MTSGMYNKRVQRIEKYISKLYWTGYIYGSVY